MAAITVQHITPWGKCCTNRLLLNMKLLKANLSGMYLGWSCEKYMFFLCRSEIQDYLHWRILIYIELYEKYVQMFLVRNYKLDWIQTIHSWLLLVVYKTIFFVCWSGIKDGHHCRKKIAMNRILFRIENKHHLKNHNMIKLKLYIKLSLYN